MPGLHVRTTRFQEQGYELCKITRKLLIGVKVTNVMDTTNVTPAIFQRVTETKAVLLPSSFKDMEIYLSSTYHDTVKILQ